jgi:3-deoxy-7-phosphoheptulonate synthase
MNMEFYRKLPIPKEIKEEYPLSKESEANLASRKAEIKKIFSGESNKFALIIGPCSADREDAVLDYISRLREVQEKVLDKILIIPRLYTSKPRTTADGYMGMLHHPDPNGKTDMLGGIVGVRKLHMRAISETGFGCADEMLYPENHRYLSDLLAYVAVGARSVENQQHRLVASGLDVPVGMKNPTGGDLNIMLNSIRAAQNSHVFLYRGWEVKSQGNNYAHAILRGHGKNIANYHSEDILKLYEKYIAMGLKHPAVIVDTNHANSGKDYLKQVDIAKEVVKFRSSSKSCHGFIKGLMIESYLEDGAQIISDNPVYGKSVTDPCLGWEKTERLIYDIADML